MNKKIARIFPRKTNASPCDELAFFGPPDIFARELGIDEVHVSVSFTWDKEQAEFLAYQWAAIAPTKISGPAYNIESGDFVPGMYLKNGYVITSRGCQNKCWFCNVWKREKGIKELPIREGWILQDDNILACSNDHILNVFQMLSRQRKRPELRGIEAKLLNEWNASLIAKINPSQIWCALDDENDIEPLYAAGRLLKSMGIKKSALRSYVLIGYNGDSFSSAELRLKTAWRAGFIPFAMLFKNKNGSANKEWVRFQKIWCRVPSIKCLCKNEKSIYD